MTINKTRKILIAIVAILGAFTAMQANAGVAMIGQETCRVTASIPDSSTHISLNQTSFTYRSYWETTGAYACNTIYAVPSSLRTNSSIGAITIEYKAPIIHGQCIISAVALTQNTPDSPLPQTPQIFDLISNSPIVTLTSSTTSGVATTTLSGGTYFALGFKTGATASRCEIEITSVKDSTGNEIYTDYPFTTGGSSGGSGGVITFPEEPLITHDVGTTLALSTLIGIMSILTMLYVVRNH